MKHLALSALFLLPLLFLAAPAVEAQPAPDELIGGGAYLGEIRWFGGNFAPAGWLPCEGQLLSIASNSALFSLLGTQYGGDGRTDFALPDLTDRFPIHQGSGPGLTPRTIGSTGGATTATISESQMGPHTHALGVRDDEGTSLDPTGRLLGATGMRKSYDPGPSDVDMAGDILGDTGGGQAHENVQPYIGLRAMIAVQGVFPSRNVRGSSTPYIADIRWFAFNFNPRGWAKCDGQLLPINQNTALFSLVGTIYGGDGRTTFGLPDLRGRVPMHIGNGPGLPSYQQGQRAGAETVNLTAATTPAHRHSYTAVNFDPNTTSPAGSYLARAKSFIDPPAALSSGTSATSSTGGGAAHNNMAPFVTLNACIALDGTFPSRNTRGAGDQFLGEVRWFASNFAPQGFADCDGQLLAINSNQALFSILGTSFGGDGRTTFGLPEMRGRVPIHPGGNVNLGERGGLHEVALTINQIPAHSHTARAYNAFATTNMPSLTLIADSIAANAYINATGGGGLTDIPNNKVAMANDAVANGGGGQPHSNMQPYLGVRAIIALVGIFPSQN